MQQITSCSRGHLFEGGSQPTAAVCRKSRLHTPRVEEETSVAVLASRWLKLKSFNGSCVMIAHVCQFMAHGSSRIRLRAQYGTIIRASQELQTILSSVLSVRPIQSCLDELQAMNGDMALGVRDHCFQTGQKPECFHGWIFSCRLASS